MIHHVSIGVKDIARSRRLYDPALAALGYKALSEGDGYVGYGVKGPKFWVAQAERPVPADEKSGLHICFGANQRADVDAFHKAALKAGGRDNGKPGLRSNYGENYYAAFVIDPDGYRIEAYCDKAG